MTTGRGVRGRGLLAGGCVRCLLVCAALVLLRAGPAAAAGEPAAGEAGRGVDAYARWLQHGLGALAPLIPAMTASAETAAKHYIVDGWDIGVIGDPGAYFESSGRSGGLMTARAGWKVDELSQDNAVVLLSLRDDQWGRKLHKDLVHAREQSASGRWKVIAIGRQDLIDRAKEEGISFVATLPVPAPEGVGLFAIGGDEQVAPTTPALKVAAMWMWFGEFVGACTRRGAMPPMYMGYALEGGKERAERLQGKRLHDTAPPPVAAGRLAGAYLAKVREETAAFFAKERDTILTAATRMADTHRDGGNLWAFLHNHSLLASQINYPHSPNLIRKINGGWFDMRIGMDKLGPDDVILCIGFDRRFHGWRFENWDQEVRETGATLIWSFALRSEEDRRVLAENDELLIDQHWAHGDAVVSVPGYDIKILPSSGVACHAVLWGVHAELVCQLHEDARVASYGKQED